MSASNLKTMMNDCQGQTDTKDLSAGCAHTSLRLSAVQAWLLEAGYLSKTKSG